MVLTTPPQTPARFGIMRFGGFRFGYVFPTGCATWTKVPIATPTWTAVSPCNPT